MAPDEVNYETLKGRLYRERRNLELTKLDADFYAAAERHLHQLVEELRKEEASNPSSPKALVLHDEVRNLQRVREDIYEVRERKIVAAAQTAARGGNPDRTAMTTAEGDLYETIVRALKDARRTMLKRATLAEAQPAPLPSGRVTETTLAIPPASVTAPADPEPAPRPAIVAEAIPGPGRARSGRVLIRPLEDLPAFTAPDLRTYRLRTGDVAAVPLEVARALAAAGKAVVLEAASA